MRIVAALLSFALACGGSAPPTKTTTTAATPAATTAPPVAAAPAGSPFGRYTVVAPAGYAVEAREIEIGFRKDDILILALDGAEFTTPPRDKCEGQLLAFAMGVATGLARAERTVNVVSSKALPNGCSLTGTTSGTPVAYIEAAVIDLGIQGPAIAFLIHARPDDGASTTFDEVVRSIARREP